MPRNAKHEISKVCAYCETAQCLNDKSTMLCAKKGVVSSDNFCRKFKYDPLKRNPNPPPSLPAFTKEDFIL